MALQKLVHVNVYYVQFYLETSITICFPYYIEVLKLRIKVFSSFTVIFISVNSIVQIHTNVCIEAR